MDERTALDVTAVRALETGERARADWTDADRAWASRAAAEVVGEHASPEAIRRPSRDAGAGAPWRARCAVRPRDARAASGGRGSATPSSRGASCSASRSTASAARRRINLLAPPVFLLLVWNLAVYVALALALVVRYGEASAPGPLRAALARFAGGVRPAPRRATADAMRDAPRRSRATGRARPHRCTPRAPRASCTSRRRRSRSASSRGCTCAALRSSTARRGRARFSTRPRARAPRGRARAGCAGSPGIAVPDVAQVAAIRAPASENAAPWLHLMAATRRCRGRRAARRCSACRRGWSSGIARRTCAMPLAEPYFQRLLRGFRGGAGRACASCRTATADAPAASPARGARSRALRRQRGADRRDAPVAYGDEDAPPPARADGAAPLIALFNATATPEREAHGAIRRNACASASVERPVIVLVDESAFSARWRDDDARLDERARRGAIAVRRRRAAVVSPTSRRRDLVGRRGRARRGARRARTGKIARLCSTRSAGR